MRNWIYIILLIFLVPRPQARVKNIPKGDPKNVFGEIDEFFKKLACPENLLKPKEKDSKLIKGSTNTSVDLGTRLKAQARFELINALLKNSELAKKCSNIGALKDIKVRKGTRTCYPILEFFRQSMCVLFMIYEDCWDDDEPERPAPPPPPSRKRPPTKPPSPSDGMAVCTPVDHALIDGKVVKVMKMKCTYPNQTSVLMPMPESGQPGAIPPTAGDPQVQIIQNANVKIGKPQG